MDKNKIVIKFYEYSLMNLLKCLGMHYLVPEYTVTWVKGSTTSPPGCEDYKQGFHCDGQVWVNGQVGVKKLVQPHQ